MKKYRYYIAILCYFSAFLTLQAQDKTSQFRVEVADTVGLNEVFTISFTLENIAGKDIDLPDLEEDFVVVGGPSISNSSIFINGTMSQKISYSYQVKAKKIGTFVIESASIFVDEKQIRTAWKKITVLEEYYSSSKIEEYDFFKKWRKRRQHFPPQQEPGSESKSPKEKPVKKGKIYRL